MTEKRICGQLRELDLDYRRGRFVAIGGIIWTVEYEAEHEIAMRVAFGKGGVRLQGRQMDLSRDRVLRVRLVDLEGVL